MPAFDTPITEEGGVLAGPSRGPRNMLTEQTYDGHASMHDDATARKLGFKGGAVEGPTHYSQFTPLACAAFGDDFLARGCLSAHYRNPVFDGETVRAFLRKPAAGETQAEISMIRDGDGAEILRGTASIGPDFPPSALDRRLAELPPLADPVILAEVRLGMISPRIPVRMDPDQNMGHLYPFSLNEKLEHITEPSAWYVAADNPHGRAVMPMEMISVLMQHASRGEGFPSRGPAVGLFADQEIRLLDGPVFVSEAYEVVRQVIFLSGSRRTESMWTRSTLYRAETDHAVASMILNLATMKESYAPYEAEHRALYG
jgi:hypothetical protein